MIILSARGNLRGDVNINGKLISGRSFGKQIIDLLKSKDIKNMPKWLVLLACGVGQEKEFIEDLAQQTKAVVFGAKFVVSRSAPQPQLEFDYAAKGSTTGWSLNGIKTYDVMGDELPTGVVLRKKLRMEFTPTDSNKIQKEINSGADDKKIQTHDRRSILFHDVGNRRRI